MNLVEDWAILLFVATTSKNMPATKTTQPVNKEPLCRPKEVGDERKYMLSPNKQMASNQRMMHSTRLLPPQALETLELRINDKIIDVIVDSDARCNLKSEHVFHSLTGGGGESTLSRV